MIPSPVSLKGHMAAALSATMLTYRTPVSLEGSTVAQRNFWSFNGHLRRRPMCVRSSKTFSIQKHWRVALFVVLRSAELIASFISLRTFEVTCSCSCQLSKISFRFSILRTSTDVKGKPSHKRDEDRSLRRRYLPVHVHEIMNKRRYSNRYYICSE